jgi:hypothetical protein
VLSLAFSVPLAMVLTGRRMSLPRASAAALVAQAALHLLYSLGTGGAGGIGARGSAGAHAAHAGPASTFEPAVLAVDHGHVVAMPIAHLVAAALTVAMLAMYARAVAAVGLAFAAVVRGVRLLVSVLTGLPVPAAPGHARPVTRREAPPNPAVLILSSLRHRGPPMASSAA